MKHHDFLEEKMKAKLYRHLCPPQLTLGEYQLKLLSSKQETAVANHLKLCQACQDDLAAIESALAQPLAQEQPQADIQGTQSALQKAKLFVINLLQPPTDVLIKPTWQPALRGEDEELHTQLYQIAGFILAISIQKDLSQLGKQTVFGDVSQEDAVADVYDFSQWRAFLWQNDILLATLSLGEDGYFSFGSLTLNEQPLTLIINGPEVEIHLQQLQLP